ncbi:hypothetical protein AB0F20_05905 [Streptomyces goshikiensis]|uniref:hypothetical protein n=1 Tax=Streptomyces goshikiensis TaxID=1942 RepID=UPI003401DB01
MRHALTLAHTYYRLNTRAWEALRRMAGPSDGFVLAGVLNFGSVLVLVGAGQTDVASVMALAGLLLPLAAWAAR